MRRCPVHIDGDTVRNRRDQQIEARCPIFLILDRAIGEPPLSVGVDRGGKGMTCFAFIEAGRAGATTVGVLDRKSVVEGKGWSVRLDISGGRINKKKTNK